MDNLTHSLIGLTAAKSGLERLSPLATGVCVVAANAPDADIIAALWGEWVYLDHHRGITHSIIGTLALAVVIPTLFYAGERFVARIGGAKPQARFKGLLLASLIVSATHSLADWTNNYGVRLLLPWSTAWQYGDFVFIIDPYLWLSLGGAAALLTMTGKWRTLLWAALASLLTAAILFLPERAGESYPVISRLLWLAGLAGLAVAHRARLAQRYGRAIAGTALVLVIVYWGALALVHARALSLARTAAGEMAAGREEQVLRLAAMPTLANPLRWRTLVETDRATYKFDLHINGVDAAQKMRDAVRYERLQTAGGDGAEAVSDAARNQDAKRFLDFARFPVARVQRNCAAEVLVQLADLRYTEPGQRQGQFSIDVTVSNGNATTNKP